MTAKGVVLKAYELVPETHRQRFQNGRKGYHQSHMHFARELGAQFQRWCGDSKVDTWDRFVDLMVLEQFQNSLPGCVVMHIGEIKVWTPSEAAVLAGEVHLYWE